MVRLDCRAYVLAALLWAGLGGGAAGQGPRAAPPGSPFPSVSLGHADPPSGYEMQHSWFSRDKLYHFTISAVGAGGLYAGGRIAGLKRWQAVLVSAGVMGAVGVLREIAQPDPDDLLTRRKLSRKDLWWDAAGIVVGISVTDAVFRRRTRNGPAPRRGGTGP